MSRIYCVTIATVRYDVPTPISSICAMRSGNNAHTNNYISSTMEARSKNDAGQY